MLALFFLGIITALFRAWYNYQVINKKDWHTIQAIFVGVLVAGFIYIYQLQIIDMQFISYENNWHIILNCTILTSFFLTPHWITHDIALNLMRKLPWDYINPKGKSIFDRLGQYQIYMKGFLLFLSICYLLFYYL